MASLSAPATVKATIISPGNTFSHIHEMSTDLPAEALGQLVADVIQEAWRAGDDAQTCTVVLTFN